MNTQQPVAQPPISIQAAISSVQLKRTNTSGALEKPILSQPTVPQLPTLKRVEKPATTPQPTSIPTSPQLPVLRKSTDSKPIKPDLKAPTHIVDFKSGLKKVDLPAKGFTAVKPGAAIPKPSMVKQQSQTQTPQTPQSPTQAAPITTQPPQTPQSPIQDAPPPPIPDQDEDFAPPPLESDL